MRSVGLDLESVDALKYPLWYIKFPLFCQNDLYMCSVFLSEFELAPNIAIIDFAFLPQHKGDFVTDKLLNIVLVETPGGPAPPLVTGTFGSVDFIFSVLGEG